MTVVRVLRNVLIGVVVVAAFLAIGRCDAREREKRSHARAETCARICIDHGGWSHVTTVNNGFLSSYRACVCMDATNAPL